MYCSAAFVLLFNRKNLQQMGPASSYRKFYGEIDADMGDSISSCDGLPRNQSQNKFPEHHKSLSHYGRC